MGPGKKKIPGEKSSSLGSCKPNNSKRSHRATNCTLTSQSGWALLEFGAHSVKTPEGSGFRNEAK